MKVKFVTLDVVFDDGAILRIEGGVSHQKKLDITCSAQRIAEYSIVGYINAVRDCVLRYFDGPISPELEHPENKQPESVTL